MIWVSPIFFRSGSNSKLNIIVCIVYQLVCSFFPNFANIQEKQLEA